MPPWSAMDCTRVESVLLADTTAHALADSHGQSETKHTAVISRPVIILDFLQKDQRRTLQVLRNVLRDLGQRRRVGSEIVDIVRANRHTAAGSSRLQIRSGCCRRVRPSDSQCSQRQQRIVPVRRGDNARDVPNQIPQFRIGRILTTIQRGPNNDSLGVRI